MGKTLLIKSYRGINYYIRYLYSRWYELDVVYKGGMYVHQLWAEKSHTTERRATHKETEEGAVRELSIAAIALIENLIAERSLQNQTKKYITTLWQKLKIVCQRKVAQE